MAFNSLKYFLFLPCAYLLFCLVPDRVRWIVLLTASFLFYASLNVPYLPVVLLVVALISYTFGLWIHKAQGSKTKTALLWGGVAAHLAILVAMKYLPFLSENLKALLDLAPFDLRLEPTKGLVAVGVSYFVFQAMSYLFDVQLELEEPERNFGHFLLYLAFFPKLMQGPIERAADLLPQLKKRYCFEYENMRLGLLLLASGLFKKVVIADRLGLFVDAVYNDVHAYSGLTLLWATYSYAFQLYLDFSGYTDMAIGSAKLFNIDLTKNFNSPYLATSVADFWRRWHITFSRWILDYIFKPLQMQWRNWKNWGSAAALIAAFVASGIWHGASWRYVIWGGLHGTYMACSIFYKPYQKRLQKALGLEKSRLLKAWQVWVTFNLVSFAWVFFRASSLGDALYVISNLFTGAGLNPAEFLLSRGWLELMLVVAGLFLLAVSRYVTEAHNKSDFGDYVFSRPTLVRWNIYLTMTVSIILFGLCANSNFIYNNF